MNTNGRSDGPQERKPAKDGPVDGAAESELLGKVEEFIDLLKAKGISSTTVGKPGNRWRLDRLSDGTDAPDDLDGLGYS